MYIYIYIQKYGRTENLLESSRNKSRIIIVKNRTRKAKSPLSNRLTEENELCNTVRVNRTKENMNEIRV